MYTLNPKLYISRSPNRIRLQALSLKFPVQGLSLDLMGSHHLRPWLRILGLG